MESRTKIALFCLIAVSLISSSIAANTCRKITEVVQGPKDDANTVCVKYSDVTDGKSTAKFTTCSTKTYCPFQNYQEDATIKGSDLTCLANDGKSRSYPGQFCTANEDCMGGKVCTGGVCQGTANGEKCTSHSECNLGYACISTKDDTEKKCRVQITNGNDCTEDYDCVNTHGCYDGKCVEYFSVDSNTSVKVDRKYDELSPCKSGKQDGELCVDVVLATTPTEEGCTGDCSYKVNNKDPVVTRPNTCDCRFDGSEKKACYEGTTSESSKKYVELAKSAVKSLTQCHTAERKLSCNAYNTKVNAETFKTLTDLYFYRWMRDNSHKAKDLTPEKQRLLVQVVFTDYANKMTTTDTDSDPYKAVKKVGDNHVCPKFSCNKNKTKHESIPCVTINKNETNTTNVLLTHSCNTDYQRCDVDKFDFTKNAFSNSTTYKCVNKTFSAFGGDETDNLYKCHSSLKADGKKCKPIGSGDKCTITAECDIGKYCNTTSTKCEDQLAKDKDCKSTFDCKNNLLCLNKKCKEMFSVNTGEKVELPESEKALAKFACKSSTVDSKTGTTCVELFYKDAKDAKEVQKCIPGRKCTFFESTKSDSTTGDAYETVCECGINGDGNAYCPIPFNLVSDKLKKFQSSATKKVDNKCNSMSRFSCKQMGYKSMYDANTERLDIYESQYFYKSVDCAYEVLSSTFIKISSAFLVVIVALLF